MSKRITFPVCVAYAWCLVIAPSDPANENSDETEVRQIKTATGDDAAEAANNLAERFNLDPATEIRVIVINVDADDPTAPGAEVHVPAGRDPDATFDPAAPVKE